MKKRQLLAKASHSAYYTLILKLAFQGLSLLATVQLIRILTQEDFGIYSLFYAVIPLSNLVASLGLINVLQRYAPEYYLKEEYALAHRMIVGACLLRLVVSGAVLALLLVFWEQISPLIKLSGYQSYFSFFILAILAFQQWGLLKTALEAQFLHKQSLALQVIATGFKVAGYYYCSKTGSGLLGILLVDVAFFLFLMASHLIMYLRHTPKAGGMTAGFDGLERRRLGRYGLFNHFNDAGVQLLDTGIDNMILAYFMDPKAVAIYAFCDQVARKLGRLSPTNYLGDVIRPLFFSMGVSSSQTQINTMIQFLIKYSFLYYVPVFFFVLLAGADLINLIFGKYGEYHYVLVAVLGFMVVNEFAYPIGLVAQLKERANIIFYSKIFGIYNLIADLVFIKYWGVMGAVVATGSAMVLKNVFIWWFTRRDVSLMPSVRMVVKSLIYWGTGAAMIYIALIFLATDHRLILVTTFFLLLFAIYVLVLFPIGAQERQLFEIMGQKNRIFRVFLFLPGFRARMRAAFVPISSKK